MLSTLVEVELSAGQLSTERKGTSLMSLLKIAHIGHPVLRTPARALSKEELASASVQRFIDDLVATMRDADGAGLAANQVFEPMRICAIEVRDNPRYPYKPNIPLTILVNPEIEAVTEEKFENYEGCLSVPNLRALVPRFVRIRLRALDRHGQLIDETFRGLTACTLQHECDHLDGKIFVDRVVDPTSFATWAEFDRHHRATFVERAKVLVAKEGS